MELIYRRVYEGKVEVDGLRILVDRMWPRGLTKERASVDLWPKSLTPSAELRKLLHAGTITEIAFGIAYETELQENPAWSAFQQKIRDQLKMTNVTLLFASTAELPAHVKVLLRLLT